MIQRRDFFVINQGNNRGGSCGQYVALTNRFRQLWSEHVMWTRSFIISTAADLGDLPAVTQRLLRNPQDFGAALQKFYGVAKAQKFQELLTEHLTIAAQLVNAAKAGNTEAVQAQRKKWYQNADEIAQLLASINPFWSRRMWQAMLYQHLKLTEEEATLRLGKRYAEDVALYDAIEEQAMDMADTMVSGLVKQFNL